MSPLGSRPYQGEGAGCSGCDFDQYVAKDILIQGQALTYFYPFLNAVRTGMMASTRTTWWQRTAPAMAMTCLWSPRHPARTSRSPRSGSLDHAPALMPLHHPNNSGSFQECAVTSPAVREGGVGGGGHSLFVPHTRFFKVEAYSSLCEGMAAQGRGVLVGGG